MTQTEIIKLNAIKFPDGGNLLKQTNLLADTKLLIKPDNKNTQHRDSYTSKESPSSLVSPFPLVMFCLDKNFNVTNCSSTALFWFNVYHNKKNQKFSFEDLLGKNFKDLFSHYSKSLETALKNAFKGKSWSSRSLKYKTDNKDSYNWLKWRVFPWLNENNEITNVIICLEDVTAHRELLLSHKKLQQNNELLESFSLMLSHDLMQPLRQIANFLGIIQENYQGVGPNEGSMDYIFNVLQKSFEHIQNLSEGISLYCKAGNLTVESERISLKYLIKEVHESILKTEKCQLNLQLSEDVYLYANRTCMLQLFQNLLVNAIKHSSGNNCVITLSGEREDENFYKFHLHNHGYCPSHVLKKNVFLPFQSATSEGAGLGLMICQKIISAYKGKITLQSEKRKGTVVSFSLPVYSFDKTSQKNEKKLKKFTGTGKYSWH